MIEREDIERAEKFRRGIGGRYDREVDQLAAEFYRHRLDTKAALILSLRHDFDDWPDYVALADVADALEATPKKDNPDGN